MMQGHLTLLGAQSTPIPTLPELSPELPTAVTDAAAAVTDAAAAPAGQPVVSLPLPFAIGLAALLAVLVLCVVILLIKNARLRKKQRAGEKTEAPVEISQIKVGKLHAQGAREYQQDCFAVSDPALIRSHGLLAIVADGMGGLEDGDKVSMTAVETILGTFPYLPPDDDPERQLLELTRQAVQKVNHMLGDEGLRKSGSTLAMGLLKGRRFYFLSMGDSHIYLLRDGALMLLNREHTFRGELVLRAVNGELSMQEAYADERGDGLVSFVGMGQVKYIDVPAEPVAVRPGDKFILMSDGVYNALEEDELCAALEGDAEEAAGKLNELIAAKGYVNQDNYTGVILQCVAGTPAPDEKEV